jgi:hypothetical protein
MNEGVWHMTESLRILLANLIDYAGLFPPAALTMEPTVTNYDAYRRSKHSWLLARLVMPVARLGEFEAALGQLPPAAANREEWRLTSPLGPNVAADVAKILEFNRRHAAPAGPSPSVTPPTSTMISQSSMAPAITIESVEMRAANAQEIRAAASQIPKELQAYFEIPIGDTLESSLAAITETGARAKVRTGGEAPEMFPTGADLAHFFTLCKTAGVPFKASAGLHRPVRGQQPYTYKPDSASGTMHGFLNVFLTAAMVRDGMSEQDAAQLLAEQSPEAFLWEEKGAAWRTHCIGNKQLAAARRSFCLTVGSCSFAEPLDNLTALGLV